MITFIDKRKVGAVASTLEDKITIQSGFDKLERRAIDRKIKFSKSIYRMLLLREKIREIGLVLNGRD